MSQVIIVGGGIAGLSVAYELFRRGTSFTLLEAGGRAGGVVLSEQVDGFTIDAGPDSLLVQKPEGIRLCEELGLAERLVPTKRPRIAWLIPAQPEAGWLLTPWSLASEASGWLNL